MIVQTIKVNDCTPQTIVIGRRGTYDTLQIAFDLSYLVESFGNGVAVLAVKRSQDESAYPAVTSQEDDLLLWTVSETDTFYPGLGECELMWYVDGGLAKTIIYPCVVMKDILATSEEAPDAYQTWVDSLIAEGTETLRNAQDAAQSASDAEAAKDDAVAAKEAAEAILEEFTTPTASATTLSAGSEATATYSDGNFAFGIPRGADGDPGDPGVTPDFSIGTVTTLEPTQPATATITGTAEAPVLNLGIPKGAKGDPGQGSGSVDSVNGQTGDVVLDAGDLEYDDEETYAAGSIGAAVSDAKNAIDTKAPVIINTASGDIITFADGADGMPIKHLIANIEAVQEGSGDPSPENIRPISGWTGLTGARTGKNLIDNNIKYKASSTIIAIGNQNEYTVFLKKGTYSLSVEFLNDSHYGAYYRAIDDSENTIIWTTNSTYTSRSFTLTKDSYFRIWLYRPSPVADVNDIGNFQLEKGSTATDYEPYQGQTISVSWETEAGTVYGGTLDVVTGELTVDKLLRTFDGTEAWRLHGSIASWFYVDNAVPNAFIDGTASDFAISSAYVQYCYSDVSNIPNNCFAIGSANLRFVIKDTRYTSVEEWQTYLATNNLQIVYTLATPQTYQLDPITVSTLLGNNTVYVDCGSVTVDYPADTGIVVAEQSNAISQKQDATSYVTLSGTIVTQTGADNAMYLCGELAELTFTAPATGQTAIRFSSGTTPTVATFSGVTWLNGFDPTAIEASKTYEINILNGLGCAAWT